jgi:hypothetical protein
MMDDVNPMQMISFMETMN